MYLIMLDYNKVPKKEDLLKSEMDYEKFVFATGEAMMRLHQLMQHNKKNEEKDFKKLLGDLTRNASEHTKWGLSQNNLFDAVWTVTFIECIMEQVWVADESQWINGQ